MNARAECRRPYQGLVLRYSAWLFGGVQIAGASLGFGT